MKYAALLRGINVGGNHKLPMADLVALLEALGCSRVRTYIQSGNAVFEAPARLAATLPRALPSAILGKHGFSAPVVLRSGAELADVVKANPFLARGADREDLHVGFLADRPSHEDVQAMAPKLTAGDSFAVVDRHVYLSLPKGVAGTKLTNAYFDASLKTVCTVRNWRTVTALAAMSGVA